jgi:sugar phosphate isomerase/epimerase
MRFGLVGSIQQAPAVSTGFEFIEIPAPQLHYATAAAPILAANNLLPGDMKIAGPDVVLAPIREHIHRICERAESVGVKTLIFDAGAARSVPEDFDRKQAKRQILEFLRMALPFCARYGIMLVCQPVDPAQSNMINTLPEAVQYVWEVDHPNFQAMLDVGLFLSAREPLENLSDAMPWIRHVHAPGGRRDLRPIFSELKRAGYDGLIGLVPAEGEEVDAQILEFLKQQWTEA